MNLTSLCLPKCFKHPLMIITDGYTYTQVPFQKCAMLCLHRSDEG